MLSYWDQWHGPLITRNQAKPVVKFGGGEGRGSCGLSGSIITIPRNEKEYNQFSWPSGPLHRGLNSLFGAVIKECVKIIAYSFTRDSVPCRKYTYDSIWLRISVRVMFPQVCPSRKHFKEGYVGNHWISNINSFNNTRIVSIPSWELCQPFYWVCITHTALPAGQ